MASPSNGLEGTSPEEAREAALLVELCEQGAAIDVVPRRRPDGVRGLFAARDLDAEERACWVPGEAVLELGTCDAGLREAIDSVLAESERPEAESTVFARMAAMAAGYLLERGRGPASKFRRYIEALPPYPPTTNTFSAAERQALKLLSGGHSLCPGRRHVRGVRGPRGLDVVHRPEGQWPSPTVPSREDVEAAFFFVLSRMSYLRMIPLVDLANAALPGEENARIVAEDQLQEGREGCALVLKRPVKAGEEVVIDYNHHDALGMLAAYGCTLGMEHTRSVTRLEVATPAFLRELAGPNLARRQQLFEDEPDVLPAKAVMLLRMASMGSAEELLAAVHAGYFQGSQDLAKSTPEERERWAKLEALMCVDIAQFCMRQAQVLEERLRPALEALEGTSSLASSAIRTQYETDLRLLGRCREVMQHRAAEVLLQGCGTEAAS